MSLGISIVRRGSHERHDCAHCRRHRPRHRGHRPRGGMVLSIPRAGRICRGRDALSARHRLDPAAGIGAVCPCGAVHAGRGLDAADRRSCPGRCLLCAGRAPYQGADRSVRDCRFSFPGCDCHRTAVRSLCRAVVGDPRRIARNKRTAVRLSAQDADPAVCRSARLAGHRAGDPCRFGAGRAAAP